MKGPDLLVGLWQTIERAGGEPSINTVVAMARLAGLEMRRSDAYRILLPFREKASERSRNTQGTLFPARGNNLGTEPSVPHARTAKESSSKITSSLREDALWVQELRKATEGLSKRELRSLSPDERFVVARYHAAIFAYCNRSERNNRVKAQQIAVGIKNLTDKIGRTRAMADLSVVEYIGHGQKTMLRRDGAPWYTPIDVYELIELEPAL